MWCTKRSKEAEVLTAGLITIRSPLLCCHTCCLSFSCSFWRTSSPSHTHWHSSQLQLIFHIFCRNFLRSCTDSLTFTLPLPLSLHLHRYLHPPTQCMQRFPLHFLVESLSPVMCWIIPVYFILSLCHRFSLPIVLTPQLELSVNMHNNEKLLLFFSCCFCFTLCHYFPSCHFSSTLLSCYFSLSSSFFFWSILSPLSQCALSVCLYLNFIILITLWLYPMSFPPEVCKSSPPLSLSLPVTALFAPYKSPPSSPPPPSRSLLLTHLSLISALFYSPCVFTLSAKPALLFHPFSLFLLWFNFSCPLYHSVRLSAVYFYTPTLFQGASQRSTFLPPPLPQPVFPSLCSLSPIQWWMNSPLIPLQETGCFYLWCCSIELYGQEGRRL